MLRLLKTLFKLSPLYPLYKARQLKQEVVHWEARGKTGPAPALIKRKNLAELGLQLGIQILVETGTFMGDTLEALKGNFKQLYSVELSPELHHRAKRRFINDKNIILLQGDSGQVLGNLVPQLQEPALFWLDGHYSAGETAQGEKDSPIMEELSHIFASPIAHSIIIDDAREFSDQTESSGYCSLETLQTFVSQHRPGVRLFVKDDAIYIPANKTTSGEV